MKSVPPALTELDDRLLDIVAFAPVLLRKEV